MLVLNDGDHLIYEIAGNFVQDSLKKGLVVVQLEGELELELEAIPDGVVLPYVHRRQQSHFISQKKVELARIFPILPQSVHFYEAWLVAAFCRDMELIRLLGVVYAVLVRESEQKVKTRTCCQVSVVHRRLRHPYETIIQG